MKYKRIIFYTLGIVVTLYALNFFMKTFSVFLYNYEDELRVLAEPLEKQYFTFYQKNKRTPSTLESAVILKTTGCEQVIINESSYHQNLTCLYEGRGINVEYRLVGEAAVEVASRKNLHSSVIIEFYNSECLFGFNQKGKPRRFETDKKLIHKIECRTSPNFRINH